MTIKFTKGNINPTTKKYPRTLREAFPDAPEPNFEEEKMDKEDRLVLIACAVIFVILVTLVIGGWL